MYWGLVPSGPVEREFLVDLNMNLVESGFSQIFFTACSRKIIIEKTE